MTNRPLKGLKVLEMGQLLAGPFCASVLAGFGAEVSAGGGLGNETAVQPLAERILGFGRNDLQAAAVSVCAEVGSAVAWLAARFARFGKSRMTGSGSAVFARIGPAAVDLETGLPVGWQARCCESLEVHPLAGWAAG